MKKTIVIAITFGVLIGCGSKINVNEIKEYINETDNRTDLAESITEFVTENENDVAIGGMSIYKLTDSNNRIYRIVAEVGQPNEPPANYEFYFKKNILIFARMAQFDEKGEDTITDSEYYFKGADLIKQVDKKINKMDCISPK